MFVEVTKVSVGNILIAQDINAKYKQLYKTEDNFVPFKCLLRLKRTNFEMLAIILK